MPESASAEAVLLQYFRDPEPFDESPEEQELENGLTDVLNSIVASQMSSDPNSDLHEVALQLGLLAFAAGRAFEADLTDDDDDETDDEERLFLLRVSGSRVEVLESFKQ